MEKKILIRLDDMCPTMNRYQFGRAIDLLDKYNVKALLGVIPKCEDPELQIEEKNELFWKEIKKLQERGYTIAMHGYTHVYDSKVRGNVNQGISSEFAGKSYDDQLYKIKKGKQMLQKNGIDTDIFFAPSHSYDNNTLKALNSCGFKYISDGYTLKPVMRYGVICIPCRSTGCPNVKKKGHYTAVFHPNEWIQPEKAICFNQLEKLLRENSKYIKDFNIYIDQEMGKYIIQDIVEKCTVWFNRYLRVKLSYIKHNILKL